MQAEILAANPNSRIRIRAVNDAGHESGVAGAAGADRTIPILQDTVAVGAWALWGVQYRDVVVLDGDGNAVGVYNLTDHNLAFTPDYDDLLDALRLAAGE
jgi:hypothetical protein